MKTYALMNYLGIMATTAVVAIPATGLAGCGVHDLTGGPVEHKALTAVIPDNTGSTAPFRRPGGPYENDTMTVLDATARDGGTAYLTTVDGEAVRDGTWEINGKTFATPFGGGNGTVGAGIREEQAQRLRPRVRQIIGRTGRAGTDLPFRMIARLMAAYPDRRRAVVLMTDGAVNLPGVLDFYRHPPLTEVDRQHVIARLRQTGELPPLNGGVGGPVKVWIAGLGRGVPGRRTAEAILPMWRELVAATGGRLIAEDADLHLVAFP